MSVRAFVRHSGHYYKIVKGIMEAYVCGYSDWREGESSKENTLLYYVYDGCDDDGKNRTKKKRSCVESNKIKSARPAAQHST